MRRYFLRICLVLWMINLGALAMSFGADKKDATGGGDGHGGSGKSNRLIDEASPYLLQHAYNPVDWYPWGDEALEKARKEDKPIFLSIGYSTCHWCHVMAKESFSDKKIAAIMNKHFVCIKVDREERPDVDSVYMKAVQAMTGSGGWPLSVFLTPDGKPFYGGTYFPPVARGGMPGFDKLLLAVADAWTKNRKELLASSGRIMDYLSADQTAGKSKLSLSMQANAAEVLSQMFDSQLGGFGRAPKFPQPSYLSMLMGYHYRTGDESSLAMAEKTLEAMAKGGLHDHLGGGFHRYSTDRMWLVPHFEKMLYDQALLSRAYVQAYQITGKKQYADIARRIFDYVLRDLRDAGGGFFSGEDADSEGVEGTFYVWDKGEIEKILGKKDARLFNAYYGVTSKGNFDGSNILNITRSIGEVARELRIKEASARESVERSNKRLFYVRAKRVRPHRDEKIIAGWNGLMISSLAYGGAVLGEKRYVRAAAESAEFVLNRLNTGGRLKRYYGKGKGRGLAVLDDYSFLTMGLIDLYQADFESKWLVEANGLAGRMVSLFADKEKGGFFLTGSDGKKLITRGKDAYDGAIPSGNSYVARVLLTLGQIRMDQGLIGEGKRVLEAFSGQLKRSPISLSEMVIAVDFYLGPRQEIVIAGKKDSADTTAMISEVRRRFLPRAVVLLHAEGKDGKGIEKISEFVKMQKAADGKATAYVCENYVCRLPLTDLPEFGKVLDEVSKVESDRK